MRILPKWIGNWPAMLVLTLASVLSIAGCGGSTSSSGSNVTATPTFNPGAGTYTTSQTVTIADTTSGAILYCTTDGTTPTTSSSVCSNPATVSKTEFMQAIAVAPGKFASAVASAGYVINLNAAPTPAFSPAGGTYTGSQSVTISDSLSGANIYYTTDGSSPSASGCSSTPSASATLYTGPITVSQSEILSAIATASGYCNSGVATAAYTIQAPVAVPTIGNLSPTSATVGGSAFTLTVNGTNFDSGSTVKWGSTALTTTYVSSTQLTASVPANLIASAGSVVVSVVTSAGASAYSAFAVSPAVPTITGLSPTSATAGGAGFTLTVNGTNFDSSAKVNWNGAVLATTYVSTTQVTAAVPANLIASAGTASITVSTTAGSSGTSTITIQSGTPTITGINPTSATAGGAAFTLTVNGTNFDSSAKVNWNGTSLTTSYVNASQVTASVPANLIASAGTASIVVTTATGTSAASSFTVQAAAATITSISPTFATVGGAAFTLTVNGTNFDSSTKVNWNGAALTTAYISGTKVTTNVPASLIASVGTANISVTTNAGTSAVSTFTIQLGAPTIATISPTSVTVGGSAFTLTVNGSNFDSSAVVKWNGTALATTPLSPTQLTAAVPANLIVSTGSASITVATSVGTSPVASSIAIQQAGVPTISTLDPASVTAGGSAFLLTVNGTGFDSSSVVKWNGTALTTIYVNSTELQTAISANLVASGSTVSVTVSGTGGASTASSFAIKLGTPTISGFNPTSASSGDSSFTTLTVNGTNFDSSAVVNWNSTALTTTFVNATQVSAAVPASLIASPVTASITVTTTAGTSAASSFTVNLGKPTIGSTDPTSVTAGGASFPLKVYGTNFDSSAKINWNGTALTTQLKNATEVYATIDSTLIAAAGSATITVTNSAGTSGSFTLSITVPSPAIKTLTPTSGAVGDTVVIAGSNFGASQGTSTMMFGTTAATVSSGNWSNNSITTTVPAGVTGTVSVAVTVNGVQSNTDQTFTVTAALPTISGKVVSGPLASGAPIIGSTVKLYSAGITGYGSAGTLLGSATATTSSTGSFSVSYQCPAATAGDELYLVATGGSTTSGSNNGDLVLITALGSCNASTFPTSSVVVNEVSTVASAYALAQFSTLDTTSGHGILIGASSGNAKGLSNAMLTVNNLYTLSTGQALSITPTYAANGGTSGANLNSSYVPQARINTLANILNSCVNTADGSGCGALFTAAKPSSGSEPADTLQAILNVAKNPGSNVSDLFGLQSSAFTPAISSAPTDWTMALTYTGGGLGAPPASANLYPATPVKMAIDAEGGIWITIMGADAAGTRSIARFDNQGNALSPSATAANSYNGGLQPALNGTSLVPTGGIAFDTNGYMWIASPINSNQTIAKLDADGNAIAIYEGIGSWCANASDLALDTTGHLWLGGVPLSSEWPCMGAINTSDGSAVDSAQDVSKVIPGNKANVINSIVIDPLGAVWGVAGNGTYPSVDAVPYLFTSSISGGKTPLSTVWAGTGNTLAYSIATDADGNLYTPSATAGGITKAATSATSFNTLNYSVPSGTAGVWTLAVDGAGHLWGAAYGGAAGSQVTVPSYLVEFDSNGNLLSPSNASSNLYGYTGTGGGGETHPILADYSYADPFVGTAVDSSGNLWVTSGESNDSTVQSNELVEFIGLAAPVRTPIAAALKNGEVGTRPLVRSSSPASSVSKADRAH